MSSEGSDIEMQSALPKKAVKKTPKSPSEELLKNKDEKKIATKDMIQQALIDLKSRKGTSLYAIKKYLEDKYKVDVEKKKYIIKKFLIASVEAGTIVQTKGVGATGSFKLAAGKDKPEKKKKKKAKKPSEKSAKGTEKKSEKSEKEDKPKKTKKVEKKAGEKQKKNVEISKEAKADTKDKKDDKAETKMKKPKVSKMAKGMQTPAKKKAAMMKRKSIGSIIKPPKMKPK